MKGAPPMPHDAYEFIAQSMRYIFAALMLLIVIRAARITLVDSRRAAKLRRLSPSTGIVGEMVVLEGDERAKKGMRYPAIREGSIGSGRSADIRIRHSSIRRRHAIFQMTEDGLHIRGHAGARIRTARGELVREITLTDGANFAVGRVHLLLVLSEATASEEVVLVPRRREPDDLFDVNPDGYHGNPTLMRPRPDTDRRDEFRRIRREVMDPGSRPVHRSVPRDPFDDPARTSPDEPLDGIVRPRTDKIRHANHTFDEPRRPVSSHHGQSPVQEGIRRSSSQNDLHPDHLFDVDDNF